MSFPLTSRDLQLPLHGRLLTRHTSLYGAVVPRLPVGQRAWGPPHGAGSVKETLRVTVRTPSFRDSSEVCRRLSV